MAHFIPQSEIPNPKSPIKSQSPIFGHRPTQSRRHPIKPDYWPLAIFERQDSIAPAKNRVRRKFSTTYCGAQSLNHNILYRHVPGGSTESLQIDVNPYQTAKTTTCSIQKEVTPLHMV
jgi:hypothetical protein